MTCSRCGWTGIETTLAGEPMGCPSCFSEQTRAEEAELREHVAKLPTPLERGAYAPRRVMRGESGAAWLRGQRKAATPGRNDPCWCNSGTKYKRCHGR